MKRLLWVIGIVSVLAITAVSTYAVFAQTTTPENPDPITGWHGRGRGSSMGGQILRPYMQAAITEGLGISVEELQTANAAGLCAWDIARENGISETAFEEIYDQARTEALSSAVADGVITADLAEAMQSRFEQMAAPSRQGVCDGNGSGGMQSRSGMGGRGSPDRNCQYNP